MRRQVFLKETCPHQNIHCLWARISCSTEWPWPSPAVGHQQEEVEVEEKTGSRARLLARESQESTCVCFTKPRTACLCHSANFLLGCLGLSFGPFAHAAKALQLSRLHSSWKSLLIKAGRTEPWGLGRLHGGGGS